MKFIAKNKWWQDLINRITYRWTISRIHEPDRTDFETQLSPLWVTGFFRSGTSLSTRIVSELGYDLGPESHLLQPKGVRAHLNSSGFHENYLFMDWSLSVFDQYESWGHIPPEEEQIRNYSYLSKSHQEFAYQSIVEIHDDRISNVQKSKILRHYYPGNFETYLKTEFSGKIAIKNPHFAVLSKLLIEKWPDSKFLVLFRNPSAALTSMEHILPGVEQDLYVKYYQPLLSNKHISATFMSYDHMISSPELSIERLKKALNINMDSSTAVKIIDPSLNRHKTSNDIITSDEVKTIYSRMLAKAINVL